MSNMGCIYSTIGWLISLNIKYKRIQNDPERKASTVYFGVYSMVVSVFCAGLIILCAWGVLQLYAALDSSGLSAIVMWLFIAMLALVILVLAAELVLGGLFGVIYQFRCNAHPIRYVALAVYVLTISALAGGLVFVL